MKIMFDTNIILDVLLNRTPYADTAIDLFSAAEDKIIQGYLCATTITTIDYLITRVNDKHFSKKALISLLKIFKIAEVNQNIVQQAIQSNFSDFEDAVLYYSGYYTGIQGIVTRNVKDFKTSELIIFSPIELLDIIQKP
ncbi:PIN domain-containing protein [Methylomonas paludis]|uniref:PIN domain-containing protein n=2 Tax=Methylomonas paludis TaxID=1173101 RepID=A0A975RB03_9GAMM|nr:PIN domain-containing protein [Methylomonas paludis]